MPEMHFVDSSNIEAIGYQPEALELHVRFLKSGATYVYYGVESWVFEEFMAADSKGAYFGANIRDRFATARI